MNKNIILKTSYNEYKDLLLNKKCFKVFNEHRIGIVIDLWGQQKMSLFCFDDKIYILFSGIDEIDCNLTNICQNIF